MLNSDIRQHSRFEKIRLQMEEENGNLPREEFESSRSSGVIHMRPKRRSTALRGAVPTFSDGDRLIDLCNLCLRHGVYFAAWRGSSGAVTFIDLFDGPRKIRYECTTDSELKSAVLAATQELDY